MSKEKAHRHRSHSHKYEKRLEKITPEKLAEVIESAAKSDEKSLRRKLKQLDQVCPLLLRCVGDRCHFERRNAKPVEGTVDTSALEPAFCQRSADSQRLAAVAAQAAGGAVPKASCAGVARRGAVLLTRTKGLPPPSPQDFPYNSFPSPACLLAQHENVLLL